MQENPCSRQPTAAEKSYPKRFMMMIGRLALGCLLAFRATSLNGMTVQWVDAVGTKYKLEGPLRDYAVSFPAPWLVMQYFEFGRGEYTVQASVEKTRTASVAARAGGTPAPFDAGGSGALGWYFPYDLV